MLKPLFATIAATTTITSLTVPATAASLFYDIKFFDGGVQVGTGEFSYDPTDSVTFDIRIPQREQQTFTVFNDLEIFKAVIQGVDYTFSGSPLWWWNDVNGLIGGLRIDRGFPFGGVTNEWFFQRLGNPFVQFFMTNARVLEPGALWGGTWAQQASGNPPVFGDGTWEITPRNDEAVPEPATMLGSLVGLAWLARKRLTSASAQESERS